MLDERPRIVRQALGFLKDIYGDKVLSHGIRRCIKVNEAQTELTDLFSFSPYCTAANDYSLVIKELLIYKYLELWQERIFAQRLVI